MGFFDGGIAVTPDGRFVYLASWSDVVFRLASIGCDEHHKAQVMVSRSLKNLETKELVEVEGKLIGLTGSPGEGWRKAGEVMFVFIDESGSFDGSPKSSRYAILTSVRIKDRITLTQVTKILKKGYATKARPKGLRSLPEIKASQANPELLHYVYREISKTDLPVGYVVLDKRRPKLRGITRERLYLDAASLLAGMLYTKLGLDEPRPSELVFYIDRFIAGPWKDELVGIIAAPPFGRFEHTRIMVNFVDSTQHKGVQLADYCAYAIYQKYERDNTRWSEMLKGNLEV